MYRFAKRTAAFIGSIVFLAHASLGLSEVYLGAYGGASFPNANDVNASAAGAKVTAQDVVLDTSAVFGGKVGYWFEGFPYLGMELEAYHYNPDVSAQTVSFVANGTRAGTDRIGKLDIGVTTIGFNVLAKLPGHRVQPYLGIGPGIFITRVKDTGHGGASIVTPPGQTDIDTSIGFQAIAGLRVFVTKQIALFTEYKFTHSRVGVHFTDSFLGRTNVTTPLNVNYIDVGLTYHFSPGW